MESTDNRFYREKPTADEDRSARVDASIANQLQRSMELNARMKNRLQRLLDNNHQPSRVAVEAILKDEDPL